ncbi:putative aldo-keto reductase [Xylariaceae sp. FL1019]|nr:putative aldo-keto reductase [Xylariaceae sp. FL1019]
MAALYTKTFRLNNGSDCPAVGLGTFQGLDGADNEEEIIESIVYALKLGYRLIDTAPAYGVEAVVGKAIRASGVPRSELTVITKLWNNAHHDPSQALDMSLEALGLDYVDMFLMHWPCALTTDNKPIRIDESPTFVETWKKMEKVVGPKCKGIGVSNFSQKTLNTLLQSTTIVPVVNQIELHALNPNLKLVPFCQSKGIHVIGWRQVCDGNVLHTHELFGRIAASHDCTPAVVSLSWAVQRGASVIPKSSNKGRLEENLKLVNLNDEEIADINRFHESTMQLRLADHVPTLQMVVDGKTTIQGWTTVELGWDDEQGNCLT